MTKRDTFIFIIKLFGLYFLVNTLFALIPEAFNASALESVGVYMIYILVSAFISICLLATLLYNAPKMVSFFRLDKGFDSDNFNLGDLKPTAILRLGLIIVGCSLMAQNIPFFITHAVLWFSRDVVGNIYVGGDNFSLLSRLISIILGYVMVVNSQWMAAKMTKQ